MAREELSAVMPVVVWALGFANAPLLYALAAAGVTILDGIPIAGYARFEFRDPFGNRVVSSKSPLDNKTRVEILVEVCDPSEDASFSYTIDGVTVSDFYTPRYLDAITAPGVRYSFTGSITKARQVLKGGYISFHDLATDRWTQITFFGAKPTTVDLGKLSAAGGQSIRAQIDRATRVPQIEKGLPKSDKVMTLARSLMKAVDAGSNAKGEMWRAHSKKLTGK